MSTKVDNLAADGWTPQQPFIPSGADWKLGAAHAAMIGDPMEIDTALGTSGVDTTDGNKRWIKPYASTDSSTVCVGVCMKNKFVKGHANDARAGQGAYRRDMSLLVWGIIPMLNVGSSAVAMSDRVAPLYNNTDGYRGFGKWAEGNKMLGYCYQAEIPAGHWGWIFVTAERTPANSADVDDLTSVTITGPLTAGDILRYSGSAWVDVPLSADALTDVIITGPLADGDVLVYDTTAFKDVPLTLGLATDVTIASDAKGDCIMRNAADDAYINARLYTELIDTPVTTGDNHVFTSTKTPLAVVSVFASGADQVPDVQYLYDATATVPTLCYNTGTKSFNTNKATDADTHILVTYWGDPNEA